MEHTILNINHFGMGEAYGDWVLYERLKMQRLYYIIGGKGAYRDCDGTFKPMEHNKIYIFPYNFYAEFKTDDEDKLNHLYFDFLSTPPIVWNTPIIYDVPDGSDIKSLIEYAMRLFERSDFEKILGSQVSHVTSAESGSFDEKRQLVYYTLHQILLTLSSIRRIPFLRNDVVGNTVKYIRENIDGDLSLKTISDRFGFERHYFIRRFKEVMNETPHAYIKNYRLLMAKEYLSQGLSYDETASRVGYMSGKSLWNALAVSGHKEKM